VSNVVAFTGLSFGEIAPQAVLEAALAEDLATVVLIGRTQDGEVYFSSSIEDGGRIVLMLEKLKAHILAEFEA